MSDRWQEDHLPLSVTSLFIIRQTDKTDEDFSPSHYVAGSRVLTCQAANEYLLVSGALRQKSAN